MKLILSDYDIFYLPPLETVEERIELVNKIIEEYPLSFELSGFERADKKVFIRLDILGTYILNADKRNDKSIMTKYKMKARKFQEPVLSNLPENSNKIVKNIIFSR